MFGVVILHYNDYNCTLKPPKNSNKTNFIKHKLAREQTNNFLSPALYTDSYSSIKCLNKRFFLQATLFLTELQFCLFFSRTELQMLLSCWLISCSEWNLSLRPLNSVSTLWPTQLPGHEFCSHSEPNLYSYSNFIVCSVSDIISAISFVSRHVYFNRNFLR